MLPFAVCICFWAVLVTIAPRVGHAQSETFAETAPEPITIYRDYFGVPHIYANTAEGAVFGVGYAQAEDRLEELLLNYMKAAGRMAEVFGPDWYTHDVRQRMWRHEAKSRELYHTKSEKIRGITEAYQAGIKLYMERHPHEVPDWAPEIEPWQVSALGRYIIWGWPEMGEAAGDLRRGGVQYDLAQFEYHGSNQWTIAPERTADGFALACIDPHLSWYGHFRFYEARVYGGELAYSGMGIVGLPLATLGHSEFCSTAMTTGGPDTADVYKDFIDPADPLRYRYENEWREMEVIRERIAVLDGGNLVLKNVEFHYTHRGPVVARRGDMAYSMAIPYFDQVYQIDQVYKMNTARNLEEMKQAIGMRQYMSQNIMVATVDGDIYYVRNGRVPIRPDGWDFSRPVPGYTADTEWLGIHDLKDLVQITNPPQGYMQNCNVSPSVMMEDSPLLAENYPGYIYNDEAGTPHQRAAMTLEHLRINDRVTIGQALEIAMSTQVYGHEAWIARMNEAWRSQEVDINADVDATFVRALINDWDGHSRADSTSATAYLFWKRELPEAARKNDRYGGPPDESMTDADVIDALRLAAARLQTQFGRLEVAYGDIYRVGRDGADPDTGTYPVGGGKPEDGMATPRNIGFKPLDETRFVGVSGQTSTQIVQMTRPPKSWTYVPLGQSDAADSAHFDDQAKHLFGPRRMKPTYFMDKDELLKNVRSQVDLSFVR